MTNRELDAEIHGRVMGLKPNMIAIATNDGGQSAAAVEDSDSGPFYSPDSIRKWIEEVPGKGYEFSYWKRYPNYSTDLNEAFRVIEKMREKGIIVAMSNGSPRFHCGMSALRSVESVFYQDESPARAICLCALKVIEEMGK